MALDGNIKEAARTPDDAKAGTVNFNSISAEKQPAKPVQIAADSGVFNRNLGANTPQQGNRAHPFDDGSALHATTGGQQDAPPPGKKLDWKDRLPELQSHRDAEGDKMQQAVHEVVAGPVRGNAVEVGLQDNAVRGKQLIKHWADINPPTGMEAAGADVINVVGVMGTGFAVGQFVNWKKERDLNREHAKTEPLRAKNIEAVVKMQDKVNEDLHQVEHDAKSFKETAVLQEKQELLKKFRDGNPDSLQALSRFNQARPDGFTREERTTLQGMAENEVKLQQIEAGLKAMPELNSPKGFYKAGKTGMWHGVAFATGGLALNSGIKLADHLVTDGDHHEFDRIFTQNVTETVIYAGIGATQFRETATVGLGPVKVGANKLAVGAAAWLTAREEKMTTNEALVTTGVALAGTYLLGKFVPSLAGAARKEIAEATPYWKSAVGKAIIGEATAFGLGRVASWSGLGTQIPELQNTSSDAWAAMKKDSEKMTGSSLTDAVDGFTTLGAKWQGGLAAYDRDIMNGLKVGTLREDHGTTNPLLNYKNIVINTRTGMALSEALGNSVLKSGFTEDTRGDLMGTFRQQTADEKPAPNNIIVAPNQGDLDLTSRAARNYMQAIDLADKTVANMQQGQKDSTDTSLNGVSDSDIKAVQDEKAKIVEKLRKDILRTEPGASAHDIQDIVEKSQGLDARAYKYTLTDYAAHDAGTYSKIIDKIEDKALGARDSWLPQVKDGPNGQLAQEYVAKMFRDAAVMRLAYVNNTLIHQDDHSSAPGGLSIPQLKLYMSGSDIGDRQGGAHGDRNVDTIITAAYNLDPNNPDMKEIINEYKRIQKRVSELDPSHDPYNSKAADPFGIKPPAGAVP